MARPDNNYSNTYHNHKAEENISGMHPPKQKLAIWLETQDTNITIIIRPPVNVSATINLR